MSRSLTYCTNVHPGETVEEILNNLAGPVRNVARLVSSDDVFPVGLWLPHKAACELTQDPKLLARFQETLDDNRLSILTFNVFPYGGFHRESVKESVYSPSWLDDERVSYTCLAGDVMAALLPEGGFGSMSTVAGAHRPLGRDDDIQDRMAENLRVWIEHAHQLLEETGKTVALALEPEPWTTFETMKEIAFFLGDVVFRTAENVWSKSWGISSEEALERVRKHLGVCFDLCHQAVMFEEPRTSVATLVDAQIPIHKVQISNALEVSSPHQNMAAMEALISFNEPRYLHQSLIQNADGTTKFVPDLDELPTALAGCFFAQAVRTHFHVPLYAAALDNLGTTRDTVPRFLEEILSRTSCQHFEVETYTFSVLPADERDVVDREGLSAAIAKELDWAARTLSAVS